MQEKTYDEVKRLAENRDNLEKNKTPTLRWHINKRIIG